jgi:hypothetical protein
LSDAVDGSQHVIVSNVFDGSRAIVISKTFDIDHHIVVSNTFDGGHHIAISNAFDGTSNDDISNPCDQSGQMIGSNGRRETSRISPPIDFWNSTKAADFRNSSPLDYSMAFVRSDDIAISNVMGRPASLVLVEPEIAARSNVSPLAISLHPLGPSHIVTERCPISNDSSSGSTGLEDAISHGNPTELGQSNHITTNAGSTRAPFFNSSKWFVDDDGTSLSSYESVALVVSLAIPSGSLHTHRMASSQKLEASMVISASEAFTGVPAGGRREVSGLLLAGTIILGILLTLSIAWCLICVITRRRGSESTNPEMDYEVERHFRTSFEEDWVLEADPSDYLTGEWSSSRLSWSKFNDSTEESRNRANSP